MYLLDPVPSDIRSNSVAEGQFVSRKVVHAIKARRSQSKLRRRALIPISWIVAMKVSNVHLRAELYDIVRTEIHIRDVNDEGKLRPVPLEATTLIKCLDESSFILFQEARGEAAL
jgi:hypothetical protein